MLDITVAWQHQLTVQTGRQSILNPFIPDPLLQQQNKSETSGDQSFALLGKKLVVQPISTVQIGCDVSALLNSFSFFELGVA